VQTSQTKHVLLKMPKTICNHSLTRPKPS